MGRRLAGIAILPLLFPALAAMVIAWFVAPAFLHPIRRPLTPDLIQQADVSFAQIGYCQEMNSTKRIFITCGPSDTSTDAWLRLPFYPQQPFALRARQNRAVGGCHEAGEPSALLVLIHALPGGAVVVRNIQPAIPFAHTPKPRTTQPLFYSTCRKSAFDLCPRGLRRV
jgi:hypothetical protein